MIIPARKKPFGFEWTIIEVNENWTAWKAGDTCALSSVVYIEDEHLPPHYEWLVSFSKNGLYRLSNKEIKPALKAFDLYLFEEDNHEIGIARKYWLAVEEKYRKPCPCKDEKQIIEDDYIYSIKKVKINEGKRK